MSIRLFVLACILSLSRGVILSESIADGLVIKSLDRVIDLNSQLVKITSKLTLENNGKGSVDTFLVSLPAGIAPRLAYISCSTKKTHLVVREASLKDHSGAFWSIRLRDPLIAGTSVALELKMVLAHALRNFPAEILQKEKQLVLFEGLGLTLYSPYPVKTQTTRIILPNANIESYSPAKPVAQVDNTITYGPFSSLTTPFTYEALRVHYENNRPFLSISNMERVLELSMWGNIAVTETLDVRHTGAKLKGSFSRYEYQRENSGASSVKSFKTYLPSSALDVYYRDDIGNISTSAMRVLEDAVEVELRPRFPLFGGWKTHYTIGYNVPSYEYLYTDSGSRFVLKMRLLDHVFNDMIVEDFVLKIILPEGVTLGELKTPYEIQRGENTLHYTYLDTTGRTVVWISNVGLLVEEHIQNFQLEFDYPKWTMVREALMLICEYFFLFVLALIYVRLDFSITKDEGSETRMKVSGICENLTGHQDKRARCYTAFDDALAKLKSTKDLSSFTNAIKKINSDHKSETGAITDLNGSLKSIAPEAGEKVSELQKLDKTFREHQTNQQGLIEKLVNGKLAKQQFIDQEAVINKKKEECVEKINAIVRSF
eukprot:TRINITY_DN718_c0_g1_i1.p1 TRINITY_DN718_c0_g1~~TRINITY_DN718_c0_g1_i1.p1  ORF type:complete len:600 (-),score=215.11 TRINITY_DN718_c0_g1_i1:225-2024(-)